MCYALTVLKLGEVSVSLDEASVTSRYSFHNREIVVAGPKMKFEWKSDESKIKVLNKSREFCLILVEILKVALVFLYSRNPKLAV